jgi:hypothetical protein
MIFRLPNSLFIAFISEWLDMPSIGKLDTAVSSKNHRSQFLNSLQSMQSSTVDSFSENRGRGCIGFGTHQWTALWWRWMSIRQLNVQCANIYGNSVGADVLLLPSMRRVKIEQCNNTSLACVAASCPVLQSLTITCSGMGYNAGNEFLTNPAHGAVATLCELEEFFFGSWAGSRSGESFEGTAAALAAMFRQCPKLKKVSLAGDAVLCMDLQWFHAFGHLFHALRVSQYLVRSRGHSIWNLLRHCNNLKVFHYHSQCDIGGGGTEEFEEAEVARDRLVLSTLCQSCPLLEELKVTGLLHLAADELLAALPRHCKHLRVLKLVSSRPSQSALRAVAGLESLKELTLESCYDLVGGDLAPFAAAKLTKLCLEAYFVGGHFDFVLFNSTTGDSPLSAANITRTLEHFRLEVVTDGEVDTGRVGASLATCPRLKTLHVEWGDNGDNCMLGVEALQVIVTGCPLLADVALSLTASECAWLAAHCPHLKKCRSLSGFGADASAKQGELQTLYPHVEWDLRPQCSGDEW